MKIEEIKIGMEIRCLHRKLAFMYDGIKQQENIVYGRAIKKDGCIGRRILKERVINVYSAQSVIAGFERIEPSTGNIENPKKKEG